MSIVNLKENKFIGEDVPLSGEESGTTLCFAMDSGYLTPFKVLIYSMCVADTMTGCPIVIYTDDPSLLNDPVVRTVADRVILSNVDSGTDFDYLRFHCLKRQERGDWHRGTFLKWRMFEPQVTPRALFLDADMLCLRPLEPILLAAGEADLAVCPQFQKWIGINDDGKARDPAQIGRTLCEMAKGVYTMGHKYRINSGMMLAGSELLSDSFRFDLINKSKALIDVNEQGLISKYFRSSSLKMKMIPSVFNFQESYLRKADLNTYKDILRKLHIVHYAGGQKPWSTPPNRINKSSFTLWHEFYFNARLHTRLF